MGLLRQETFVCLDCESTGLEPETDHIIEIAVARFSFAGISEQYGTLVDPECPIPESSIAIHHITETMVQGKPKIAEVLPTVLKLIGNHILVGHHPSFDIELIAQAATRANIPCNIRHNPRIDTLRLARHYGGSPVNSLEVLRQHFNIPAEGAHRAMNDVLVNIQVFKHLAERYITLEKLMAVLAKPIRLKNMPLGKHKGRPLSEIPLDYLLWAAKKDFDIDLSFSVREELNNRKKGSGFNQAGNPFADL